MQHQTLIASQRFCGVSEYRTLENCVRMSGLCNPTCIVAVLRMPAKMKVASRLIEEAGKGQTHSIDIACRDESVCGGFIAVDQRSVLTAGTNPSKREQSDLSWRAAVIMTVQKSKVDDSNILSIDDGILRMGWAGW